MTALETANVWGEWNRGPLESFLIELSAQVCAVRDPETGEALVDVVLDKAGQKGTGRWTAQVALELGVAIPAIAAAIDARVLSSQKEERVHASSVLQGPNPALASADRDSILRNVHDGLLASRVCAYAQGMSLIAAASHAYGWNVDLSEVCRIWTGGCIIRARLLDDAREAFAGQPELPNLLLSPGLSEVLGSAQDGWRRTVHLGADTGIPMPAHAAALSHFDAYRTARLPQNLTQAQRDAFGAHTYERTDRSGPQHSTWER
jgi:6-phosphogluconate dehydrogenase